MNRIVIELSRAIAPDGAPYVTIGLLEPDLYGEMPVPMSCSADDPDLHALLTGSSPVSVSQAGGRLYGALLEHPQIRERLESALLVVDPDRCPVYIKITASGGEEALPWEALYKPSAGPYLGLDQRWALARMVAPQRAAPSTQELSRPVRIAAVLSCLGVPADGELAALRRAMSAADPGEAEMLVLSSEDQLVNFLQAEIAAGRAPGIEVEGIPPSLEQLQRRIAHHDPHLLHLFCHGSAEDAPHVAIAIREDWITGAGSSLLVEADQFRDFTSPTASTPWLIVLNCCEGAQPAADTQSLALSLVLDGIAPAVIGMRRPTVAATANAVAEAVLKSLLKEVLPVLGARGNQRELEWPRLVLAARRRLTQVAGMQASVAAASTEQWTLPVLYVRPEPFVLQSVDGQTRFRGQDHAIVLGIEPIQDDESVANVARLVVDGLRELDEGLPPGNTGGLRGFVRAQSERIAVRLGLGLTAAGVTRGAADS